MKVWCLESRDEIRLCEVLLVICEPKHKHTCSVRSPGVGAHEREPCVFPFASLDGSALGFAATVQTC